MKLSKEEEKLLSDLQPRSIAARVLVTCVFSIGILYFSYSLFTCGFQPISEGGRFVVTSRGFIDAVLVVILSCVLFECLYTPPKKRLIIALAKKIKEIPGNSNSKNDDSSSS